ncbi:MAG: hypothetical protein ACM3ZF_08180 [Mycobacterium leprae]
MIHGEVVFVALYALVLLAAAAGIARLGRVNSSPWASRVLVGHRRQLRDPAAAESWSADWPHSEVPRFHAGMALVPIVAAALLSVAELARHHRPAEVAGLLAVLALAGLTARRLIRPAGGRRADGATSAGADFGGHSGSGVDVDPS